MYLLDTNIMIEAKNRYYGFDICPGFWSWIEASHVRNVIYSTHAVRDEILKGKDDLSNWIATLPATFFVNRGAGTLPHLASLASWANSSPHYTSAAKAGFFSSADYYLIAQGRETGFTVVTHEVPSGARNRIKIPEAAAYLGVRIASPFEVMRREGARFA